MTRKQPTSSRGGREYGENTMARRPDQTYVGKNRTADWIKRSG